MQGAVLDSLSRQTISNNLITKNTNTILDRFITRLSLWKFKRDIRKIDYSKYLEKNKQIMNGKVVIKGTRIQPIIIFDRFYNIVNSKKLEKPEEIDYVITQIKEDYPTLSEIDIIIAILYCSKNLKIELH